jgi:hypothetical protein
MSRVYGDSTPFPHDLDYIHLLRDGIDCAVRLLSAQHSIRAASQRADAAEQAKQLEVVELNGLFERVQTATTHSISDGVDRTVRTAAQIVAGARSVVDRAISDLESSVSAEVAQARHIVDKARENSASALEQYLERHAPPGSRLCLQLMASHEVNVGQVTVVTPYGMSGVFGVAFPPGHPWARPRRVLDVLPVLEVKLPKESGWLSKRVEMSPVRLERYFISDVMFSDRSGVLRIRKGAQSGSGYQLRVEMDPSLTTTMSRVNEDGSVDEEHPLAIEGENQTLLLGLWQRIVESCRELMTCRRRMVSATFAERPIQELESPRVIADALIGDMAPIVVEISRRSGAPGELVLRRNLGEGRREETYCTHSELVEKVLVLPPDLRSAFGPLNLDAPRVSAAAPHVAAKAVSLPAPEHSLPPERRRSSMTGVVAAAALASNDVSPELLQANRPPSVPPPANAPPAA